MPRIQTVPLSFQLTESRRHATYDVKENLQQCSHCQHYVSGDLARHQTECEQGLSPAEQILKQVAEARARHAVKLAS